MPEKVEKKITKRDVDDDELHHNNCLRMVAIDSYRGGDYRGDVGHVTPTFWLGGRKGKCPPTDCPFSKKKFWSSDTSLAHSKMLTWMKN